MKRTFTVESASAKSAKQIARREAFKAYEFSARRIDKVTDVEDGTFKVVIEMDDATKRKDKLSAFPRKKRAKKSKKNTGKIREANGRGRQEI